MVVHVIDILLPECTKIFQLRMAEECNYKFYSGHAAEKLLVSGRALKLASPFQNALFCAEGATEGLGAACRDCLLHVEECAGEA